MSEPINGQSPIGGLGLFSSLLDENGALPANWMFWTKAIYSDLVFRPIKDTCFYTEKLWQDVEANFFPDNHFYQAPGNIDLLASGSLTPVEGSEDFRKKCAEISGVDFQLGSTFEIGSDSGTPFDPPQFCVRNFQIFEDSKSNEYLYSSIKVGALGHQFDESFHSLGPERTEHSQEFVQSEFLISDYRKASSITAVSFFLALSELWSSWTYALSEGDEEKAVKRVESIFEDGRSFSLPKSSYPQPVLRYIDSSTYVFSAPEEGRWMYVPDTLEVGWLFSPESLENQEALCLLHWGPRFFMDMVTGACTSHMEIMDSFFDGGLITMEQKHAPRSWFGFTPIGKLPKFYEALSYNGSGNSLAYGFLLPRLAEGKVSVEYVVNSTERFIKTISELYEPDNVLLREERTIASGNIAIAYFMHGDFVKSSKYVMDVLSVDPSNSEAIFIANEILKLQEDETLRDALKVPVTAASSEVYDTPTWLLGAIDELHSLSDKSKAVRSSGIDDGAIEPAIDAKLLDDLVLQFVELKNLAQKFKYIMFRDADGLRPDVGLTYVNDDYLEVMVIGAEENPVSKHFPWLDSFDESSNFEFDIPKSYFRDSVGFRKFLSAIFDTYQRLELELVPVGETKLKIKTFFPITKKVPAPPPVTNIVRQVAPLDYKRPVESPPTYAPRPMIGFSQPTPFGDIFFGMR
jgi:hypothetical protein